MTHELHNVHAREIIAISVGIAQHGPEKGETMALLHDTDGGAINFKRGQDGLFHALVYVSEGTEVASITGKAMSIDDLVEWVRHFANIDPEGEADASSQNSTN